MDPATTMTTPIESAPAHVAPGFLAWVAELVRLHRGRLVAYARRRGLTAEQSLDAVQDGFASFLTLPEARSIARAGADSLKFLTALVRNEETSKVLGLSPEYVRVLLHRARAHVRSCSHDQSGK
jgi:DNA-directed RNA polymerase specialized sigma24 family protein